MITKEPGVLLDSEIYIYEPTIFARRTLTYATFSGAYHCVAPYQIDRTNYDNLLLLFIDSGQLELTYQNQRNILTGGCLQIIDCKQPHVYRALGDVRFRWIHFNGSTIQPFYDYLDQCDLDGLDTACHFAVIKEFDKLFALLPELPTSELAVNLSFIKLFSAISEVLVGGLDIAQGALHQAYREMNERYLEPLRLDDLAKAINMSTCHFARSFRNRYHIPPHEYLLSLRIGEAKRQLLMTEHAIETVAEKCGFNSTSHFIRAFGQRVGITPAQFRKQKF
ncbi:MAG: AraC family transcriptional regulator [Eubacteriales bacterium]|nr:AraC family transcriptional regulator [Eubacteriales bacterium]